MILRCHQESEGRFEGVIDLIAAEANRETFAHAREDGQDAIATRRYMNIKLADRLSEPAIQRDFLLGLAQRGRCGARINCVDLAAWKGNLSCVVCKMRSALCEQHRRLRARQ